MDLSKKLGVRNWDGIAEWDKAIDVILKQDPRLKQYYDATNRTWKKSPTNSVETPSGNVEVFMRFKLTDPDSVTTEFNTITKPTSIYGKEAM